MSAFPVIPVEQSPVSDGLVESDTDRTYCLDVRTGRIRGFVDGTAAIEQAIYAILSTQRVAYPVYTALYGTALDQLTGKPADFVRAHLTQVITTALLQDERIRAVDVGEIVFNADSAMVKLNVETVYGVQSVSAVVNQG